MNLCKDCKHAKIHERLHHPFTGMPPITFEQLPMSPGEIECLYPLLDPVTGNPKPFDGQNPWNMRFSGPCGYAGIFWEKAQ